MKRIGTIAGTLGLLSLLATQAWAATSGPDDFGYTAADQAEDDVTYEWVDTSGGTEITGTDIADDIQWGPFDLGFTFTFYGEEYTQVSALSNGAIVFSPITSYEFFTGDQCPLPYNDAVDGMVGFYYRDFNPDDSACGDDCHITYATGGEEPDRWWALSYEAVPVFYESPDPADPVTVQVILYEGSNTIAVQVADSGVLEGGDATLGIEASDGIAGLHYGQCLTEGSIPDETAVVFTPPSGGTPVVPRDKSGFDQPGQSLDYDFFVFNLEDAEVVFDLAVSGNDWTTDVDPTTLTLAAGTNDSFTVSVDIPESAVGGDGDEATITLTPQGGGDAVAVTTLTLVQDEADEWQPVVSMPLTVDQPVVAGFGTDLYVISGTGYDTLAVTRFVTDFVQVMHLGGEFLEWDYSQLCPQDADWSAAQDCCVSGGSCVDASDGTLTPMPEPRTSVAGCGMDGMIYVTGGIGVGEDANFVADDVFIYDTDGDIWTTGAAMPAPRFEHAVVCDPDGGTVYVIGGFGPFPDNPDESAETTNTIWAYDVAGNTWDDTLTAMDGTRSTASAQLLEDGTILVAAGFFDDTLSVRTDLYDIGDDTWTRTGDLPWERFYNASAVLPDGRMCLIGGTSFAGGQYNANDDSYDCYSAGFWIPQIAVMNGARTLLSGATLGDSMYIVGGVEIADDDSPFDPAQYDQLGAVERYPTGTLPPLPPQPDPEPDAAPDAGPDGGPDVSPDVPSGDLSGDTRPDEGADATSGGSSDSGCGCATVPSDDPATALLFIGLFLGLIWSSRRR